MAFITRSQRLLKLKTCKQILFFSLLFLGFWLLLIDHRFVFFLLQNFSLVLHALLIILLHSHKILHKVQYKVYVMKHSHLQEMLIRGIFSLYITNLYFFSVYNKKYFIFSHEKLLLRNPIIAGSLNIVIFLSAYVLHIVIYLINQSYQTDSSVLLFISL